MKASHLDDEEKVIVKFADHRSHNTCNDQRKTSEVLKPEGDKYDDRMGFRFGGAYELDTLRYCFWAKEPKIHNVNIKTYTQGYENFAELPYEIKICNFEHQINSGVKLPFEILSAENGLDFPFSDFTELVTTTSECKRLKELPKLNSFGLL